jgi:hypothetical protein
MKWQAVSVLTPNEIEHDYMDGTLRVAGGKPWRTIKGQTEYASILRYDITLEDNYWPFLSRLTPNARVRIIFEYDDEDQEDGGT